MRRIFTTAVILLVLLLGGGLLFIYSGIYNVAATSRDPAIVRWILSTTMDHSVERRGAEVVSPGDLSLSDPRTLEVGFEHYNEMCTGCHGAPGVEPGEAHDGLNPKPPNLAESAQDMSPGELFWVIKHGVKMTGMPAWGPTHSDAKIWAMVAFVKKLPQITPSDYRDMQTRLAGADGQANHHHAGEEPQPRHPDHEDHRH
jgi:mono/diheme cytochrome c family protein